MTTNRLPIARTDSNGTTWYPAADGMGWTSQLAFAAPHVVAFDDNACIVVASVETAHVIAATPRTRTSHADCTHAVTPAARKACRAARRAA